MYKVITSYLPCDVKPVVSTRSFSDYHVALDFYFSCIRSESYDCISFLLDKREISVFRSVSKVEI